MSHSKAESTAQWPPGGASLLVNRNDVRPRYAEPKDESWMVSIDTLDRGGYMGGRYVALTWPSEIDGRPDWPSIHMPAPWPDVWFECSSLSTHCSKVHGSTSFGTGFAHTSTRPSVRTHRPREPSNAVRAPRGACRKVTYVIAFLNAPRAFPETSLGT